MKCKSYFSKWKITEYVWRSLRIYIAHKMSRRKWVGGSSQTFKASSSSNLCSLGHTSLHAKPTQLGWGPWRSCFCLWTISPSERPSLQGSSPLSLCRLSKSMASFAWESSAWCNGRLESSAAGDGSQKRVYWSGAIRLISSSGVVSPGIQALFDFWRSVLVTLWAVLSLR